MLKNQDILPYRFSPDSYVRKVKTKSEFCYRIFREMSIHKGFPDIWSGPRIMQKQFCHSGKLHRIFNPAQTIENLDGELGRVVYEGVAGAAHGGGQTVSVEARPLIPVAEAGDE
jgi:hypothetical protein